MSHMRKLPLLALCLIAAGALADTVLKNASGRLGPVINLDCTSDGGLTCGRTASTGTGDLRCSSASVTEIGCVIPGTQSFKGDKTVQGAVNAQSFGGADGGPVLGAAFGALDGGGFPAPLGYVSGASGAGTAFASFPACTNALTGRWLFDSTNVTWRTCDNNGRWDPVARLSMFGIGGYATGAINNTTLLANAYASSPTMASRISCVWGGAVAALDGGTKGVVVRLGSDVGTQFCSCSVGPCAPNNYGSCACSAAIPVGDVFLTYDRVAADGGVASDCSTNPNELRCNVQ